MPVFSVSMGSVTGYLSHLFKAAASHTHSSSFSLAYPLKLPKFSLCKNPLHCNAKLAASSAENTDQASAATGVIDLSSDMIRPARRSADWKAARAYQSSGSIYEGRVEGFNGGEPDKSIHEIAKDVTGSLIPVKVIQADEENRKLIFSEKEAVWSKFSEKLNVGDIFTGRVGCVEDYGAFVHLRFPDGLYHLTGLVHVSEVSWDLVQDIRDVLNEGDEIKVKIINIDRERSRITLSIKQLEEDPLLETLDKVISQDNAVGSHSLDIDEESKIEPLPGLEAIVEELLKEDGIIDVRINRQGFEKRVVSQDLQLWLSNAPPIDRKFILLARAGRQVQEIQLTTSLDQEGIKKSLQRVLERVP
ncbi:uncharacterized protein LOC110825492 isoform X2 [Carica papaya]|uniref:uncharacterized protein LOC110825492 isoform X2 n=1 Tax=Carica papaya TaxID=3649 RepID=UPI000B8CEBEB|nr:uncharacterized protein LOC110825492 isoform X2 [Carica papaya]